MIQLVQKKVFLIASLIFIIGCLSYVGINCYLKTSNFPANLLSPQIEVGLHEKALPFLAYTIPNLAKKEFVAAAPLKIEKIIAKDESKQLYTLLFSYQSQGKKISGALNLQLDQVNSAKPVIVMIRGYAPLESYYSGMGTKNAATVFANQDYATLAPDFLGFGESDPEPGNTWEARFIKVANIIDLIKTIETYPQIDLSSVEGLPVKAVVLDTKKIGLWAHSNGGQIAVSSLEVLGSNLPTTLWAPVLAPFPYSIMYFTDENEDEGKEARKYLSQFEEEYDVFDFSLTKHLDLLNGPIQIQHGTNDDSALVSWTEEFLTKIDFENEKRATASTQSAVQKEIKIDFYKYPGANHNLQPNWDEAIQKDLSFFEKNLN
jgi:dienelactone hydrolase